MPGPIRPRRRLGRQLQQQGSLVLPKYVGHSNKLWGELAYEVNERTQDSAVDVPVTVNFDEFLARLNQRARTARIRQRTTSPKDAHLHLLEADHEGLVTLTYTSDKPRKIETITILPEAKQKLAGFLPKLRGYGDAFNSFSEQYRGVVSLAQRHFKPKHARGATKDVWIQRNIEYQEEIKSLKRRAPRRTLSIQAGSYANLGTGTAPTNFVCSLGIQDSPDTQAESQTSLRAQEDVEILNTEDGTDAHQVAPELDLNDDTTIVAESNLEVAQASPTTPRPTRTFNWFGSAAFNAVHAVQAYLTPQSVPRRNGGVTVAPALLTPPTAFFRGSDESPSAQPSSAREPELSQELSTVRCLLDTADDMIESIQQKAEQIEAENTQLREIISNAFMQLIITKGELRAVERALLQSNGECDKLRAKVERQQGIINRIVGSVNSIAADVMI